MAVRVNLKDRTYITLRDEYNVESVWARIRKGDPMQTRKWGGSEVMINPDNVTSVIEWRSIT